MSKLQLTQKIVQEAKCPPGQKKTNFFDQDCKHLVLEVRPSGGKTYYVRYCNGRGQTKQFKIGDAAFITLTQARGLAKKHMADIILGADPAAEKKKLRDIPTFTTFIQEHFMPHIKSYKRSWATDESYLRNHLVPFFNKKHMDEINKRDVVSFVTGMKSKGYAPGTCNRCLILLRHALNLAIDWEIPGIKENPTKGVAPMDDHNHKERFLSQTEAHNLCDAVRSSDNTMLQYIVPMLILTGARKREVLDSKWEDFDIARKQWRIPFTKTGRPRHVPLSDGAISLLNAIPKKPGVAWVFANPKTGLPFRNIFNSWDTARKVAGLEDVRLHDLRHSFASFLVNAGRSLYEVQKILGHTQIKTTQRYAHLAQDTLLDATNAVSGILGSPFARSNSNPTLPTSL